MNAVSRVLGPSLSDALERQLIRFQTDRAVLYILMTRVWQIVSGPLSLLLIARHLSPETQGFHYTFYSLLGLQTFIELALHLVIVNVTSHEWAGLSLNEKGEITGNAESVSRLVSLGRQVFSWYAWATAVFVLAVGTIGYVFFSRVPATGSIPWQAPWFALVVISGLMIWTLPFNSILEGCNQMAPVNKFRLNQAILGSLAFWLALACGAGLWSTVISLATALVRDLWLLLVRYRRFFQSFFAPPTGSTIDWKSEIWPMQWRLALSGVVNYFAFSLYNPVMFRYHGPVVAGQMGMTLQIVTTLQVLAYSWVYTKVPRFGMLISRKDYSSLDRMWVKSTLVSVAVMLLGAAGAWAVVYGLHVAGIGLAQRMLEPKPTALFLAAATLMLVSQCQTAYLRAHKQEPILVLSVSSSLLIGLLVYLLGKHWGPLGAAGGYFAVMVGVIVWETQILLRCRRQWHQEAAA